MKSRRAVTAEIPFKGMHLLIDIQMQNVQHRLRLAGIVYYGQHHFTAKLILSDGQVWFYDGIETERNLI